MADGSSSQLTAAQRLALADAIKERALNRYLAGSLSVVRARARVARMDQRLKVMVRELERRKAQLEAADDAHCRLLLGENA